MEDSSLIDHNFEPLARTSSFSFSCSRCLKCCFYKRIQVNPYEIARIAHNKGITTTDVIRLYTDGGVYFRNQHDGACIFLTSEGCGIHPDKPLVCRLFPLARHIVKNKDETFFLHPLHSHSADSYGQDRTIQNYLNSQDAEPYIVASEKYFNIFQKITLLVQKCNLESEVCSKLAEEDRGSVSDSEDFIQNLLNIDEVVRKYCISESIKPPTDPWEKMEMHISAIEKWLTQITEEEKNEEQKTTFEESL